jgi:hypothetical protein
MEVAQLILPHLLNTAAVQNCVEKSDDRQRGIVRHCSMFEGGFHTGDFALLTRALDFLENKASSHPYDKGAMYCWLMSPPEEGLLWNLSRGTRYRIWLRHYATRREFVGSIPDEVIEFFSNLPHPSGRSTEKK